jgi:hypothetical protein
MQGSRNETNCVAPLARLRERGGGRGSAPKNMDFVLVFQFIDISKMYFYSRIAHLTIFPLPQPLSRKRARGVTASCNRLAS